MGLGAWYEAKVMPKLITCACSQGHVMKRRAAVVPRARGDVFELGCGGGINHAFYHPAAIKSYAGIDPHPALLDEARAAATAKGWDADIRQASGEAIPFEDARFDTVVCTFTLCSVADPSRVLSELVRILRPGGTVLFCEHGAAPDPEVARWQRRIEPIWKRLAGGCHLTRPVTAAFEQAGFAVEQVGEGYTPQAPRFAGWMEWGAAIKRA